jgi:glutaredoxin
MAKNITIYTTNTCAYCVMVKKYLTSKGHAYQEVNLDEKPEERQKIIELSGQMTVPVTVIDNEAGKQEIAVGWKPGQLAAALRA